MDNFRYFWPLPNQINGTPGPFVFPIDTIDDMLLQRLLFERIYYVVPYSQVFCYIGFCVLCVPIPISRNPNERKKTHTHTLRQIEMDVYAH